MMGITAQFGKRGGEDKEGPILGSREGAPRGKQKQRRHVGKRAIFWGTIIFGRAKFKP